MDLIDRQKAIDVLKQMRKKRSECGCRGSSYEAKALDYAIEVVKKLPKENANEESTR